MANIKFLQPGKPDVEVFAADNTNLREKAVEGGADLYTLKGKLMNCGGYGQCGTCKVAIVSGLENLSSRTSIEERRLKKYPSNFRLACQTRVLKGNVTVQAKPQLAKKATLQPQ
ncbi:MAG: 2Fe-2S iron-sulfur cluster-binding protein [Cyanobacteria bacterium J06641_5]